MEFLQALSKLKKITVRSLQTTGFYLLIIFLFPSTLWLFGSGYFNMHDDLQVLRIYEMVRCYNDRQIPCRWSPDMTYGYGQAMFNFYSAFPYYLGLFYKLVFGASYLGAVKFLFIVSFFCGGIGMFLLAKKFWGFWGGFLSAILYTYAPYHAVDIYVRGALAEGFALGILPFIWLFLYEVIYKPNNKNILFLSFTLFVLFTTHNISMLIYTPFTLIWIVIWLVNKKDFSRIIPLIFSGLLGLSMSAFFILPAIFEQKLVNTSFLTSGYSEYFAHFASLNQLFISRFWGDGGSIFGINDSMSFAVGWPHWWLLFILSPLVIHWVKRNDTKEKGLLLLFFIIAFLFSVFLTHQRSIFIWKLLPLISFVQFPWRFLGLSMFFLALASGAIAKIRYLNLYLIFIIIILTFIFNISYFTPVHYSRSVTDTEKLSGVAFYLQQKGGAADYIPRDVTVVPEFLAPNGPRFLNGTGVVQNYIGRTNGFSLDVKLNEKSDIVFPYIYFPNWEAFVDGSRITVETNGAHNVIKLSIPEGQHFVEAKFYNTKIRNLANTLTTLAFVAFFYLILFYRDSVIKNKE